MRVNRQQLADFFGVTTRTVQNWQSEGLPVESTKRGGTGNVYESSDVVRWYTDRRVREISGNEKEAYDYAFEKARLTHHQANIAKLDAQRRRGDLWPVDVVALALQRLIGSAKARLTVIPAKFKTRVPELPGSGYTVLQSLIRETLDDLGSERLPGDLRERLERYYADVEAASSHDGEPVGEDVRSDYAGS